MFFFSSPLLSPLDLPCVSCIHSFLGFFLFLSFPFSLFLFLFFPLILFLPFSFRLSLCFFILFVYPCQWERQFLHFSSLLVSVELTVSFQPSTPSEPFTQPVQFSLIFWIWSSLLALLESSLLPLASVAIPLSVKWDRKDKKKKTGRLAAPGWHSSGTTRFLESGVRLGKKNV